MAIQVVDAKGMYVTPGFIDIHTHVFYGPSKSDYLGNGSIADIAVISMREGDFGFKDIVGNRQKGNRRFECQLTIKGGKVVYDLNAIASKPVKID